VYCEVGRTDKRGFSRKNYVDRDLILAEVKEVLSSLPDIDCITFSGSGEPTLHAALGTLLRDIRSFSSLPIVILTNGTLLWRDDVRADLLQVDVVSPSLNAVSEDIFRRINRPHPRITSSLVREGLVTFRKQFKGKFYLEILFVQGLNDTDDEVIRLRNACEDIQPDRIHINTVVRPPAETWAKRVPLSRLTDIRDMMGPTAEVLVQHDVPETSSDTIIRSEDIISLLGRRAMSAVEISGCLSADMYHVQSVLNDLEAQKIVHSLFHDGGHYYAYSKTAPLK
jgi:wyosine [tRNA(Phe)-imidazoG37] synthetase (radical SAM superfamily)